MNFFAIYLFIIWLLWCTMNGCGEVIISRKSCKNYTNIVKSPQIYSLHHISQSRPAGGTGVFAGFFPPGLMFDIPGLAYDYWYTSITISLCSSFKPIFCLINNPNIYFSTTEQRWTITWFQSQIMIKNKIHLSNFQRVQFRVFFPKIVAFHLM